MPLKRFILVVSICFLTWIALFPARGVWAPDEARYAEVTREMKEAGNWLIPRLNGDLYTQKPPLFFDLSRLAASPVEGVPEWAVKVPSLLGALLTLLFVGLIGARLAGPKALWLAPLILGSMFKFSWQAQFGQIDMVLTSLVVMQVYVGLRASSGQGRRWVSIGLMTLLGILGVLAKGPVGCLLPWLILLAYLSVCRDWKPMRRIGLHFVVPGVLVLAAAWLLYAGWSQGWDYPQGLLFKQSVQRYFDPWHHKAPVYYFLGVLFTDGLPFSILLVPMIAPLIRKKRWREPAALLPLVWIAVYLVFFSFSPAKRSVYILPLFPAMAILLAYGFMNLELGSWRFKGFGITFAVIGVLFAALGAVGLQKIPVGFSYLTGWLTAGVALLVTGCLAALILGLLKKPVYGISAMALLTLFFFAFSGNAVVRALDQVKAPRALGQKLVSEYSGEAGRIAIFPSLVPSINYYGKCTTLVFGEGSEQEAFDFLKEGDNRALIVKEDDLKMDIPACVEAEGRYRIGKAYYLLLRSLPSEGSEFFKDPDNS